MAKNSKSKKQNARQNIDARRKVVAEKGRSGEVVSLIDPDGHIPGLQKLVGSAPYDMMKHLLELLRTLKDDEVKYVHQTASKEMLTRGTGSGGSTYDEAGRIHLAAVLAPVLAGITNHPDITVTSDLGEMVYGVEKNLAKVWRCNVDQFHLEEKNRFYYARGMLLLSMTEQSDWSNTSIIDPLLDRHIMWVGSYFEYFKHEVNEILGGNFSREFIEGVSKQDLPRFVPRGGEHADNLEFAAQWHFMGHHDFGYESEGQYSIILESVTRERFKDARRIFTSLPSGVTLSLMDLAFISHHLDENFDTQPFMLALGDLVRGLDETNHDQGSVALTMMGFTTEAVARLARLWAGCHVEDRKVIFFTIDMAFTQRDAAYSLSLMEDHALTATIVMPVVRSFFEVDYDVEPFNESDHGIRRENYDDEKEYQVVVDRRRAEYDVQESNIKNEQISDLIDEFSDLWYERGERLENAASIDQYMARCRAAAMHFMLEADSTGRDDADLEWLGNSVDVICRNAASLLKSKDLSVESVAALI